MTPLRILGSVLLLMIVGRVQCAAAEPWLEAPLATFANVPSAVTGPLERPLDEVPANLTSARAANDFFKSLGFTLTDAQKAALERDKFVLVPI